MHALVSGTFDPITEGHRDVIARAARMFERVTVGVMNHLEKNSSFSLAERAEMASIACREFPNVTVVADGGMMVDFFDRIGADVIVRGVRNEADFRYELEMAQILKAGNPRIETVFLPTEERLAAVSSTQVRNALATGRIPDELLPKGVSDWIMQNHSEYERKKEST